MSSPGAAQCGVYSGKVRHRRFDRVGHRFSVNLDLYYLDLAEVEQAFKGRWFWSDRRPAFAFAPSSLSAPSSAQPSAQRSARQWAHEWARPSAQSALASAPRWVQGWEWPPRRPWGDRDAHSRQFT